MVRGLTAGQRARLAVNVIRHSDFVRSLQVAPGFFAYRRCRQSGEPLQMDIDIRMGMGAIISLALRIHAWAAREGIAMDVISTCPLYSDGSDVFARYFERPFPPRGMMLPRPAAGWIHRREAPDHLTLAEGEELFKRLFTPNARLRALLDEAAEGCAAFDLSIHFRGTDKYRETGLVDHESVLEVARPYLERARRVFLATDDAGFARTIRKRWRRVAFVSYDVGEVVEGLARHFSKLEADDKAREALVNMFLLARAPICIRTMSYLSSFARMINPDLRTVTVNKRLDADTPFPERQLLMLEA
jgi:hypothetical protein